MDATRSGGKQAVAAQKELGLNERKRCMAHWETYLEDNQDRFTDELLDFLRIPSISSLIEHEADGVRAAEWVVARLEAAGVRDARILPTGGHPVVFARHERASDRPTVLVYGHFDTQPVDPLELWTRPPFDPVVHEGRIFARGASDDKGNMLIPILAAEAFLKGGGELPVNLKFFFEGQEEIGSPQLSGFMEENCDLLACDVVLSADGGQWSADRPCIVTGRRGLCALQVDVQGAGADLHSGTYGGTVLNPIQALARIAAGLHDADGRVAVQGFYDAVRSVEASEREQLAAVPHDDGRYADKLDVPALFGEPGYGTLERAWIRPTLEFNGIWGGYQGEGVKTVLPAKAHAKISCRLVPDQNPHRILELVGEHIRRQAPASARVTVQSMPGSAEPYVVSVEHPGNRAAARALSRIYGCRPYVVRMGGTIPVSGMFLRALGAHMINFAFGLDDECVHAPNEFFRLSSFIRGQKAWCRILEELASEKF
jgi:acetylornithine deacetylase/succinyl-diaminopimelate desuccinylase-like protein